MSENRPKPYLGNPQETIAVLTVINLHSEKVRSEFPDRYPCAGAHHR